MAPMTKGSNLPYRRLCVELGARVLMSEMVVARRLEAAAPQRVRAHPPRARRAVLRRAAGGQQAGRNGVGGRARRSARRRFRGREPRLPHRSLHAHGPGRRARPPTRARPRRIVDAMRQAVAVPVTVKIRLGWTQHRATTWTWRAPPWTAARTALTVHGRTREARYRHPADWDAIAEIAAGVTMPVDRQRRSALSARDRATGWPRRVRGRHGRARRAHQAVDLPRSRRRLLGHHGRGSSRPLPPVRRAGRRSLGTRRIRPAARARSSFAGTRPSGAAMRHSDPTAHGPTMQQRDAWTPRSALEALLARSDEAALDYVTDETADRRRPLRLSRRTWRRRGGGSRGGRDDCAGVRLSPSCCCSARRRGCRPRPCGASSSTPQPPRR